MNHPVSLVVLLRLHERICDLLAAVDGRDQHEQGAARDEHAEGAGDGVAGGVWMYQDRQLWEVSCIGEKETRGISIEEVGTGEVGSRGS